MDLSRRAFLGYSAFATIGNSQLRPRENTPIVQWGLGMEHEFAIDLGKVDNVRKERYIAEKMRTLVPRISRDP